jgi:hypothetical protein
MMPRGDRQLHRFGAVEPRAATSSLLTRVTPARDHARVHRPFRFERQEAEQRYWFRPYAWVLTQNEPSPTGMIDSMIIWSSKPASQAAALLSAHLRNEQQSMEVMRRLPSLILAGRASRGKIIQGRFKTHDGSPFRQWSSRVSGRDRSTSAWDHACHGTSASPHLGSRRAPCGSGEAPTIDAKEAGLL